MAVSETTRLGLTRWSAGVDPFNRDQMDQSHERLETKAGIFLQGAIGSRPAASAAYARAFYLATDQNSPVGILYYCDGATWRALNNFAAPSAQTPGDSIAEGTALTLARSDHKHSLPAWGVVGELSNVGTAASAGVAVKFARIDHVHVLADASVTAGKIAVAGVSASNQIANGILVASHFSAGSVGAAAISEDQRIPIGSVTMYTGTTAPNGWLFCDGASYLTSAQSALFAVIGYKYGGSGGNFNVPDFRDRLPRGAATPTSTATLGVQAGSDTVKIETPNLPSHTHGASGLTASGIGNHSHTWGAQSGGQSQSHYHGVSGSTGNPTSNHIHFDAGPPGATFMLRLSGYAGAAAGLQDIGAGSGIAITYGYDTTGSETSWHQHGLSLTSDWASHDHSHYTSGTTSAAGGWTPTISGNTAATGSGTALSVIPKSLTVNFIIKI